MLNFNDLRSKKMKEQMKKQQEDALSNGKKSKVDERLYFPKLSKDDENNIVLVRFLPSQHDFDGAPFHIAKRMKHGFDIGNKNIYFECPKTAGKDCPMCKSLVWSDTDDLIKAIYRQRKAKTTYYVNAYVIDDKQYPENNGKVVVIPFGVQLMKAIEDSIKEDAVNMFDLFEDGANFCIRVKAKGKNPQTGKMWPSFEASSFKNKGAFLKGDMDKMKEVFEKTYKLAEFVDESRIKSFEEIEKIMSSVNLGDTSSVVTEKVVEKEDTVSTKDVQEALKQSIVEDDDDVLEEIEDATPKTKDESVASELDLDDMTDDDIDNLIDNMD